MAAQPIGSDAYAGAHPAALRDQVRWGPVWAGVFVALSTSVVLGLLGLAVGVGVMAWDAVAQQQALGWGFTIWGIIVLLVSFGIGGWVAAYSSSARGERNGLLNGALVWAVAVPVMFFLLPTAFGSVIGPAAMMAQAMPAGEMQQVYAMPREPYEEPGIAIEDEQAEAFTMAAWGALIALLLGLAAAAGGGYLGTRGEYPEAKRYEEGGPPPGGPTGGAGGETGRTTPPPPTEP